MTPNAWLITDDHLSQPSDSDFAVGIAGPGHIGPELRQRLERGEGHTFYLYDDDGDLYYTGREIWDGPEPTEEAAFAPLGDFGAPYAGCTLIKWHGRPDLTCG